MDQNMESQGSTVCRTCLWESGEMKSLFYIAEGNQTLSEMLHFVTNITVLRNDMLPKHICADCEVLVSEAYAFKTRCLLSEKKLSQINISTSSCPDDIKIDPVKIPISPILNENTDSVDMLVKIENLDNMVADYSDLEMDVPFLKQEKMDEDFIQLLEKGFKTKKKKPKGVINLKKHKTTVKDKNINENCLSKPKGIVNIKMGHKLVNMMKQTKKTGEFKEELVEKLKFECHLCMRKCAKKESLIAHIKRHEEKSGIKYTCELCKRDFKHRIFLDKHIISVHGNKEGFECDICSKSFLSETILKTHKEVHNDDKKNFHKCLICSKSFYLLSGLKDHLRTHTGEKPYLCSICGKGFSQKNNMAQHMRRHQGQKPYKCDECTKSFVSKGELDSHKRKHTGAHPFICDDCGNGFTTSSSLVKHRRTHTGERPYACDLCPLKFAASSTLKNHRRTHTGEKPFQCCHCEKAFVQRCDLVTHIRCHTGERPFVCKTCGQAFRKRSVLKSHVNIHCKDTFQNNIDLQGVGGLMSAC